MKEEKVILVNVEPLVFKWLIESSGWSKEDIAKRLKTSVKIIEKIESGEKQLSFRQLEELSNIFKRPVASFLLSKPLPEKPKPKDYRMLSNKVNQFDKKTLLVIRKARKLQEISRELSLNINYERKSSFNNFRINDNPEIIAMQFRKKFNFTIEQQKKFKTSYEMFNYLRDILEDNNIYLFQFSMPIDDARGFVFVDESPNVIVVNTKDNIEARIFSLMHELGHILLGESVIDLPDATTVSQDKIEIWCNEFSSAFLLPKELARDIFDAKKDNLTDKETLKYFSNKYKVSKAMLLLNMLKLGYIEKRDYDNILRRFSKEVVLVKKGASKVGMSPTKKCISEVGNKFVSLVANNYDKSNITYTDALNYLSVKSRNFDKILSKARK